MKRKKIVLLMVLLQILMAFFSSPLQAENQPKHNQPLRQNDIAFGGATLKVPLALGAESVFTDVLRIEGVRFSLKRLPAPQALALGVLSLTSKMGTGNAIVRLRVTVDGKPEASVFSTTVFDGYPATATGLIQCNDFPADGQEHIVALQILVDGPGQVTVDAGTFDLMAFRPIWVPG